MQDSRRWLRSPHRLPIRLSTLLVAMLYLASGATAVTFWASLGVWLVVITMAGLLLGGLALSWLTWAEAVQVAERERP